MTLGQSIDGIILSVLVLSWCIWRRRSSSMDERAPMTLGQAIAGIILAIFALSWVFDQFGLVVQMGGGR